MGINGFRAFYQRFNYLFETLSYGKMGKGEVEKQHFHRLVNSPNASVASVSQADASTRSFLKVSHMVAGAQTLRPFLCSFASVISRELHQKWSRCILNQHPYGLQALQVTALLAMPKCCSLCCYFILHLHLLLLSHPV